MTEFRPILYLKQDCPFCLKVRLFLLEAGLAGAVDQHVLSAGSPEEQETRVVLSGKLDKISFPAAETAPGRFVADSEAIVAELAGQASRDPADLPVYGAYLSAAFRPMMALFNENRALKAAAQPAE